MKNVAAFLAGLLFALGLGVSGMTDAANVLAFLDLTGAWDPSLLVVMGAALVVYAVSYRLVLRRSRPLFDVRFHLPALRRIDGQLLGGAVIFGVGWGLAGFCPGPALVAMVSGTPSALVFGTAMLGGMAMARFALARQSASLPAAVAPAPARSH